MAIMKKQKLKNLNDIHYFYTISKYSHFIKYFKVVSNYICILGVHNRNFIDNTGIMLYRQAPKNKIRILPQYLVSSNNWWLVTAGNNTLLHNVVWRYKVLAGVYTKRMLKYHKYFKNYLETLVVTGVDQLKDHHLIFKNSLNMELITNYLRYTTDELENFSLSKNMLLPELNIRKKYTVGYLNKAHRYLGTDDIIYCEYRDLDHGQWYILSYNSLWLNYIMPLMVTYAGELHRIYKHKEGGNKPHPFRMKKRRRVLINTFRNFFLYKQNLRYSYLRTCTNRTVVRFSHFFKQFVRYKIRPKRRSQRPFYFKVYQKKFNYIAKLNKLRGDSIDFSLQNRGYSLLKYRRPVKKKKEKKPEFARRVLIKEHRKYTKIYKKHVHFVKLDRLFRSNGKIILANSSNMYLTLLILYPNLLMLFLKKSNLKYFGNEKLDWSEYFGNYLERKKTLGIFLINRFVENRTNFKNYTIITNNLYANPSLQVVFTIWRTKLSRYNFIFDYKIKVGLVVKLLYWALAKRDLHLFYNILSQSVDRISPWKHRRFFIFIIFVVNSYFKYLFEKLNITGFCMSVKGKISLGGNSRKKKIMSNVGITSRSKYSVRCKYLYKIFKTEFGALGLQLWLYHK